MSSTRIRAFGSAAAWAALSAGFIAAALIFSNADGIRQVSTDGAAAVQIEQAMSGASALRNAVARAVLMVDLGVAPDLDDVAVVQGEYRRRIDVMLALDDEIERDTLEPAAGAFDAAVTELGRALTSAATYTEQLAVVDDRYRTLIAELAAEREIHVAELATAGADAGRAADAARFFVAIFLPMLLGFGFVGRLRRIRAEDRMRWQVEREQARQRAKDEFIADLSHELRTPLTGIVGFAGALRSMDLPPGAKEYVEIIAGEGAELQRMVDDLIAVGKIQSGTVTYALEDVDVVDLVQAVAAPFRAAGMNVDESLASATVRVDPGRFRQVVRNLLSNAAKYGGSSVVLIGEVEGRPGNGRYHLSVVDDGPGVPDALIDRLFERYVHAGDAVTKGSVGLGLAIARTFTEGMGGRLVYRREGGWTSFEVIVALAEGPASVPTRDRRPPSVVGAGDSTSRQDS